MIADCLLMQPTDRLQVLYNFFRKIFSTTMIDSTQHFFLMVLRKVKSIKVKLSHLIKILDNILNIWIQTF